MTAHLTRDEWIARMNEEQTVWAELVAEAGEAIHEPGPMGEWTFHDLAHHVNGWRVRTIQRLDAAVEGREPDPAPWPALAIVEGDEEASLEAINSWMREQGAHRQYAEILAETGTQFDHIRAAIAQIPEESLYDQSYVPWFDGYVIADVLEGAWDHLMDEHLADVRTWLTSRA
jgi:hypothetical protein